MLVATTIVRTTFVAGLTAGLLGFAYLANTMAIDIAKRQALRPTKPRPTICVVIEENDCRLLTQEG